MTPTLTDIRHAASVIAPDLPITPAATSATLSEVTGASVAVKFENLQFTASFKERGALVKLQSLSAAERRQGVVAMSAGNHAQGVARHAARLGIPATIVMPKFAPYSKIRHTRDFGATVVLEGESLSDSFAAAQAISAREQRNFVHPYDDPLIIAGQGTVALEFLAQQPDIDTLIVPVGGGGLIAGIAIAAKALKPSIKVIGVEAALYPSVYCAIRGGIPSSGGATIADGIAVKQPGALPLEIIRRLVDDMLLVDESAIERAIMLYLEIEKTVAEGAGAVPLGALLSYPDRFRGKNVGLILSGGNIDQRLLASILMRGLVRDGRMAKFRVEITDAPGTLAKVSGLVGAAGGNIVEVYHQRLFGTVAAKSADLDIVVETRDAAHVAEIEAAIRAAGYPIRLLSE